MKKNDRLLAIATLAYSYLFYNQTAGINFLVFNMVLLGLLVSGNKVLLQSKKWLWAAMLSLLSSLAVFMISSNLSIFANICSLLVVSAFSVNAATSALFAFLSGIYSIGSSFIFILVDAVNRLLAAKEKSTDKQTDYKIFITGIVIVLCIVFFILYQRANPLFERNTRWLNLNFLNLVWLFFTITGGILLYGFFNHRNIPGITGWENAQPLINTKPGAEDAKYSTELFAGTLLFAFLNIMLVILNTGDIQSFWIKGTLPEGISQSDFVHSGVGIIIFSILLATGLIMYLFRKDLSGLKGSQLLKLLVFAWIAQNLLMLCSTVFRNQLYIHDYDLTYKRIGVYAWLFLAVIGLVIMLIKIVKNRSNWYMVKTNVATWFTVLALSSLLNWDVIITRYNIANKPLYKVDFYYLFSLSDANIPELIAVSKLPGPDTELMRKTLKSNYSRSYNERLNNKINTYLYHYKDKWQSYDLRDKRITESIINR